MVQCGTVSEKIHTQDGSPSVKRQEDATQLFIQPFIGPSCATPGLPFGIWSSLHNQKNSPSSDKRGVFLLMCSAKKGVAGVPHQAFSSIQRKMELKEHEGYFRVGVWEMAKEGEDPSSGYPPYTAYLLHCEPVQTEFASQKLGVKQPADHKRGQRAEEEAAAMWTWKKSLMWHWHATPSMT